MRDARIQVHADFQVIGEGHFLLRSSRWQLVSLDETDEKLTKFDGGVQIALAEAE